MLKNNIKLIYFVFTISLVNFFLFHIPFFKFVLSTLEQVSISSITIIVSLVFLMLVLNAFVFHLIFILSEIAGKFLLVSFFVFSSIATYFINTYGVIIDETMIGNVLNTNYEESSALFTFKLVLYLFFLGCIPSFFIVKTRFIKEPLKKKIMPLPFLLIFILSLSYINSGNWLWVDKHDTKLGALVMPWSYVVNTSRFYIHKSQKKPKRDFASQCNNKR
jgi:lipid A ethanolaminephosphotransferase